MADYDVIIIGGNVHGLTQAAYLAKYGEKVAVFEKAPFFGGSAITREMSVPGYKMNPCATGEFYVHPQLNEELHLTEFGLEGIDCPVTLTTMLGDGEYMSIYPDPEKTANEIARFSEHDAEAFMPFYKEWLTLGQMFSMYTTNDAVSWRQIVDAMCTSTEGERMLRNMLFASVTDILDNAFDDPRVKAAFLPLHEGNYQNLEAGIFFFNICRAFAPWGIVRGGIGKVGEAFENCARHWGAELYNNAEVKEVLTKDGKAYGVKLADGTVYTADIIIGNIEPNETFDSFLAHERENMPADFKRGLREMKYEGQGMTVNVALDGLPDFPIPEDRLHGFLGVSKPGYDMYQRAYSNFMLHKIPDLVPWIGYVPSVIEGEGCELVPEGGHLHTFLAWPMPFDSEIPWLEGGKEKAYENILKTMDEFIPGYSSHVVGIDGYCPEELWEIHGYRQGGEGHNRQIGWYNSMNQRPFIGYADYHTPIKGYYMAGCTAHPVSGLGGVGGRLVAKKVLTDKGIEFDDQKWRGDYVL